MKRTGRPGWRVAAATAALALAAAGCGGSSSPTSTADRLTPQAALAAAVENTAEVSSFRFALTSSTTAGGQAVEFSGGGVATSDGSAGEMTFALPGGAGELRQRIVDGVLYLELPQQAGVFYELKVSDLVDTSLAASTDVTSGLQALRGVSDDAEEVGREQVRGEDTTHYRGTLDASAALEAVKGPLRDQLESVLGSGGAKQVPFEAWIDGDGRIRQLDQTLTIENPQQPGQELEVSSRLEMYDFGVQVDVQAPPASAVRDGAPLLEAFKGLGS
jgi:hypothetical protein